MLAAAGGRPRDLHRGVAGRRRRAVGRTAGDGRSRRIAVRLLHAGVRHEPVRRAVPARPRRAVRSAGAGRQPVPMHRLSSHSRCRAGAWAGAAGRVARSARRSRRRGSDAVDVAGLLAPVDDRRMRRDCSPPIPSATLIAGGTDLGVESNLRGTRWPHLVSLEAIDELREFAEDDRIACASARRCRSPTSDGAGTSAPPVVHEWLDALCLAADPQPRDARRQSRHRVADRRRRAAAAGARRHRARRRAATAGAPIPLSTFFTGYRRTALAAGRDPDDHRDSEAAARSTCASTRSPSGGSTTSARSRPRWRSTATQPGACAVRGSRSAAWRPRRCASMDAEEAVVGQPWNEAAVERVQRMLDRTLTPMSDHRGSKEYRLRGVAAAWSRSSAWERPRHDRRRPARAARERPRPRHRRGALHRRPASRAFRACCTPGRCWRRTRTRWLTSLDAAPALDEPGVVTVLTGADVPGEGDTGPDPARRAAVSRPR